MNEGHRAEAMRAAGRALALDPESREAAEIVTTLMLRPPEVPPPELHDAMQASDQENVSRHARTSVVAYLVLAAFLPLAWWNGIREWNVIIGVFATCIVLASVALRIVFRPNVSTTALVLYALGNAGLMALLTRVLGPWTFVPAITCIIMMSMTAYPAFILRPWIVIVTFVIGYCAIIGAELQGYLPAVWRIGDGMMTFRDGALAVNGSRTLMLLFLAGVATIVMAGIHAAATYRAGRFAQQQLAMQAWHLRQLLPASAARDSASRLATA